MLKFIEPYLLEKDIQSADFSEKSTDGSEQPLLFDLENEKANRNTPNRQSSKRVRFVEGRNTYRLFSKEDFEFIELSESDQWTCKKSYAYTSPDEPDPWITLKNVVARYDDKLRKGLKKKHLHMPLIVYVTRKRSRSFQGFLAIAEKVVNMLASKQFSQEEKNELFDIFVSLDSMMVIMINDAEQYGCASHLITRETVQTWRRLRCTAIGPQWGLSTASPNHYFSSLHPCAILDASRTSRWCTRTGRRLQRHAYGLYNVLGAICDFLELEIGGAALMCWQELKESLNLGLTLLQSVCLFIFLKDTPMMR